MPDFFGQLGYISVEFKNVRSGFVNLGGELVESRTINHNTGPGYDLPATFYFSFRQIQIQSDVACALP